MEDIVPGRTGRGQSTLRWVGTKQRYIGLKMHEVAKLAESQESFWLAVIRYFAKDQCLLKMKKKEEEEITTTMTVVMLMLIMKMEINMHISGNNEI